MTNAPVNHVGMAVVLEDLPPLLWHAELGQSPPDAWTGDRHRGVQRLFTDAGVEVGRVAPGSVSRSFEDGSSYAAHLKDLDDAGRYLRLL